MTRDANKTPSSPAADGTAAAGDRIRAALRAFRRLLRSSLAIRGVSLTVAVLCGLAFVSFGIDRLFRLSHVGRALALAVYGIALAWTAWRVLLRPLSARLPGSVLADVIEGRFPELGDRLRSAVDFLRDPMVLGDAPATERDALAVAMKRRVAGEAASALERLDPGLAVDTPRVTSSLATAVVAVSALGVFGLLLGETFERWFARQVLFSGIDYEYATHLAVKGFGEDRLLGVPRGDPLRIVVEASGEVPRRVSIDLEFPSGTARYNMELEPNAPDAPSGAAVFVHEHASVTEEFEFRVAGGDYRTNPHRVVVLERPRVVTLAVTVTPPEYTGLGVRRLVDDVGELAVPAGSTLSLEGVANKPLERASVDAEGGAITLALDPANPLRFHGSWQPASGGMATVDLADREGVPPDRRLQFTVHIVPDRQPIVQARTRGLGPMVTAVARMPFRVEAKDDYRLDRIVLAWSRRRGEDGTRQGEVELPAPGLPRREPFHEEIVFEAESLGAEPDERLEVRIGATDNDALSQPKTGYAPPLSFLVVTAERLGEEFLRREIEQRRVLERIVEEERRVRDEVYRLIDASWKLDGPIAPKDIETMLVLARTERQHARQLEAIADAIGEVLAEMENNRIGEERHVRRLGELVIQPLRALAEDVLPDIVVRLTGVREEAGARRRIALGIDLGARIDEKLERLDHVLTQMERLEGFTEIVKRLRGIIKTQSESSEAARDAYRRLVDDIFEDLPDGERSPGRGG